MMNNIMKNTNEMREMVATVWESNMGYNIHNRVFDGWEYEKSKYLTKMFGEELILTKEVTIEQTFEMLRDEIKAYQYEIVAAVEEEEWCENNFCSVIRYEMPYLDIYNNKLSCNLEFDNGVVLTAGSKLTKSLKKIISDPAKVEKLQIKYSQMMNQKKLTGNLCLSIHPLDFMTMSHTTSWSSCYNLFEEGEYSAGTMSLLNSPNTIIAYLTTKDMYLHSQDDEGNRIMWNDKKWRCVVSVNPEEYILTGKNYPYNSDALTELAYEWVRELTGEDKEMFADFSSVPTLEEYNKQEDKYACVKVTTGYNDADSYDGLFKLSTHKNLDVISLYIKYKGVICPNCGEYVISPNECNALCMDCDDSEYCYHCDDSTQGDTYYGVNVNGETVPLCSYCYSDSYCVCDCCFQAHDADNMVQGANYNYYCADCASEMAHCHECDTALDRHQEFEYKGKIYCECCKDSLLNTEEAKLEDEIEDVSNSIVGLEVTIAELMTGLEEKERDLERWKERIYNNNNELVIKRRLKAKLEKELDELLLTR